jgi:hypothetical protein
MMTTVQHSAFQEVFIMLVESHAVSKVCPKSLQVELPEVRQAGNLIRSW